MTVTIEVTFLGGIGQITILIFNGGQQVGSPLDFTETGSQDVNLSQGAYVVSVSGNSAPAGTNLVINKHTTPPTPDHYDAGPVGQMYSLNIF